MKNALDSRSIGRLQQHRQQDEFRAAVRATLMTPLMSSAHPDFAMVRRHADALSEWYLREAGWPLLSYREGVRLQKRPGDLTDDTRGLPGFERRRYVLFSLACYVLERAEVQITLRTLGEQLLLAAGDRLLESRSFTFDLKSHHERKELVAICKTLLELGVLSKVAGDEEAFVHASSGEGDALYDVNRRLLANVLACARGPSTWAMDELPVSFEERMAALCAEYAPDSEDGRTAVLRFALARRLLDDPVIYLDELEDASRAYFINQRGAMARRICEATGLSPEQRLEGTALVDVDGQLTDISMPDEGTDAHVTLLVAEYLCSLLKVPIAGDQAGSPTATIGQVEDFISSVREKFGRLWRVAARRVGSEGELAKEALDRLQRLHLVRIDGDSVVAMPAMFRFSLKDVVVQNGTSKATPTVPDLLSGEFDND
jgi:uncharacterized protein (TIGR02678 family)